MAQRFSGKQIARLHYLASLEEDMEARNYSNYENAEEVRAADEAYIAKVADSVRTGRMVWGTVQA